MVRILRLRIRRDARTRSSLDQRTGTRRAFRSPANVEAEHSAPAPTTRGQPLLAAALLRFQCVERGQACREVTLHPSQPSETRLGRAPRRLAVEQLPPLRYRSG